MAEKELIDKEAAQSWIMSFLLSAVNTLQGSGYDLKKVIRNLGDITENLKNLFAWFGLLKKDIQARIEKDYPEKVAEVKKGAKGDFDWVALITNEVIVGFVSSIFEGIFSIFKGGIIPPEGAATKVALPKFFKPDTEMIDGFVSKIVAKIDEINAGIKANSLSDEKLKEVFTNPVVGLGTKLDAALASVNTDVAAEVQQALIEVLDGHNLQAEIGDIKIKVSASPKVS